MIYAEDGQAVARPRAAAAFINAPSGRRSLKITVACRDQLVDDGKTTFDPDRIMGAGYNYLHPDLEFFLFNIAARLAAEPAPSLTFVFERSFTSQALGWTLGKLMAEIDKRAQA